jgi:hypothetical protein
MNDSQRLDRLRKYFHTGEIPLPRADCLEAETIGGLADGTLDSAARAHGLKHLASCASCRRAVASVAAALADGPITHEIEVIDGGGRRRFGRVFRITVPLAAAATVLLLLWSPANDRSAVHRALPQTGTAPVLIAPLGAVAAVDDLRWTSVAGADRYRLTVFDAAGAVLYETQGPDTMAALPDSVRFIPGRPYLWKVEARTGWDRWSTSDLAEFTIARGPPE